MRRPSTAVLVLATALLAGPVGPRAMAQGAPPAPLRVLFIGNSLTASHELPLIVQAMSEAAGVPMLVRTSTPPDVDLRDHWRRRAAKILLASEPWDVVVLQQGPSTRPESREHLERWAGRWADAVRRREARPALYMVWPFRDQENGFELVAGSYRAAAEANGALLLAAGEAWQRALAADPGLALYDADGLHPTLAGSYLAALVIARDLAGVDPGAVPARLRLASGTEVGLAEDVAATLRAAVVPSAGGAAAPPAGDADG